MLSNNSVVQDGNEYNCNDKNPDNSLLLNKDMIQSVDGILFNDNSVKDVNSNNVINDFLIASLKDEITFLHKEISSKDKIIELILNQTSQEKERNLTVENSFINYIPYDKTFKAVKESSLRNVIPITNRVIIWLIKKKKLTPLQKISRELKMLMVRKKKYSIKEKKL